MEGFRAAIARAAIHCVLQAEAAKCDASWSADVSYGRMDVLIVERDDLIAEVIAGALAEDGISAAVVPTEQDATRIAQDDSPRVIITGMNRRLEDMAGMEAARSLCSRWSCPGIIYMAALWPARLRREALTARERFLPKPVSMSEMIQTVRELLSVRRERRLTPG